VIACAATFHFLGAGPFASWGGSSGCDALVGGADVDAKDSSTAVRAGTPSSRAAIVVGPCVSSVGGTGVDKDSSTAVGAGTPSLHASVVGPCVSLVGGAGVDKDSSTAVGAGTPVKTHCYSRSDGLIQTQGSAGVPKAVYD
jgi:hypothetical protein